MVTFQRLALYPAGLDTACPETGKGNAASGFSSQPWKNPGCVSRTMTTRSRGQKGQLPLVRRLPSIGIVPAQRASTQTEHTKTHDKAKSKSHDDQCRDRQTVNVHSAPPCKNRPASFWGRPFVPGPGQGQIMSPESEPAALSHPVRTALQPDMCAGPGRLQGRGKHRSSDACQGSFSISASHPCLSHAGARHGGLARAEFRLS